VIRGVSDTSRTGLAGLSALGCTGAGFSRDGLHRGAQEASGGDETLAATDNRRSGTFLWRGARCGADVVGDAARHPCLVLYRDDQLRRVDEFVVASLRIGCCAQATIE
jgi:hypothetical protein